MENKVLEQMTVVIAGRSYPLKVKEGEEQVIESIVDGLNQKIESLQSTYANKDMQDCLSMALLTYAFELHESKRSLVAGDNTQKLNKLDNLINRLLSQ